MFPPATRSQTTVEVLQELLLSRGVSVVLLSDVPTVQRSHRTVEVLQELFIVKGRSDCVAE